MQKSKCRIWAHSVNRAHIYACYNLSKTMSCVIFFYFRLRHLNLEKNEIFYVPQLKSVEGSMIVSEDDKDNERLKKSPKSGKKSSRTPRPQKIHNRKKSDHTADGSSSDPTVTVPHEPSLPVPANSEVISIDNIDTENKTDDGIKESKKGEMHMISCDGTSNFS